MTAKTYGGPPGSCPALDGTAKAPAKMDSQTVEPNYAELATKGYLIVRAFLDTGEIQQFEENFSAQQAPDYEGFRVKIPPYEFLLQHIDKFRRVTELVTQRAGVRADVLTGGVYFFTEGDQVFGWHQDRESFYTCQNHRDYLNFYIPIIKPVPRQSNLSVIPLDRLKARAPDCYARVLGRGAALFEVRDGKTVMQDENERAPAATFDFSLDELAETPELAAGDLLLLRGDVIHRTQDAYTRRVAVSVRFADSLHPLSKAMLVRGGAKKFRLMLHQHTRYQRILRYMDRPDQNPVRLGDIFSPSFGQWFDGKRMMPQPGFFLYLIRQKIRMGLFLETACLLFDLLRARLQVRTRLSAVGRLAAWANSMKCLGSRDFRSTVRNRTAGRSRQ